MNEHEIERIAAAANQLRPDWPIAQLRTLLKGDGLVNRPRRDVSVALAWVACEAGTSSPYRVLEAGPWWRAAGVEGQSTKPTEPENHDRCSTCALAKDRCRSLYADDHDFRPWTEKPQIDTKATVAALKAMLEPTTPPPEPKPLLPTDRDPAAVAARASTDREGVGTGAGEGATGQDTGTAWVTRSVDCPEAPAQAHPLATAAPPTPKPHEETL